MNVIEFGDCREIMRKWAANGVKAQTCITSPPYYGLRDYGHDGQIGLEETPEQYVEAMVEVFRCVRDVLADDGTVWLNIGDSYAMASMRGENSKFSGNVGVHKGYEKGSIKLGKRKIPNQCKEKDLIGIPWMLAFALRADGWYLRQDIIWHKPNAMPESVKDRCGKSHEYIFLLSKSKQYYFDNESIKEEATGYDGRKATTKKPTQRYMEHGQNTGCAESLSIQERERWQTREINGEIVYIRNKRSVWTVSTKSYAEAHFATYPEELIEPCVLAGAPIGGIVLDPFMGSGTTAQVAQELGRKYIGCELNFDYKKLQDKRLAQQCLTL